ncbi:unnamed protein product [Staurois parvus]|uniref:Uncharacterized protein n=1 Tax=Staurois parvus TaxID=386267 RepID=A0ABN9E959_9NEOB|nr:unnamed protein product [Staurois parvus]
MSVLSAGNTFH